MRQKKTQLNKKLEVISFNKNLNKALNLNSNKFI